MFLLIIIAILLFYFYGIRNFSYWEAKNVPYAKPLPYVGNILEAILMKKSLSELFQDLYNQTTAPFLGFYLLNQPALLIRDPTLIKQILISDFKHFDNRAGTNNKEGDPVGSYVLFLLKNPEWRDVRPKIAPALTSKKLRIMFNQVERSSKSLSKFLSNISNEEFINVTDCAQRYTVDIITSTIFGIKIDCFGKEIPEIMTKIIGLFSQEDTLTMFQARAYLLFPSLVKIFNMKFLNSSCQNYLKKLFLKIMDQRIASKAFRHDLIDILLEIRENHDNLFLDGDILIAQIFQFAVAGLETTSLTMTFALYEISKQPLIQEKLRNEIQESLKKHGGKVTYDAIQSMTYLDQCIKETLRKYPSLPFLDRECTQTYKVPNSNLTIEKNMKVFISLLGLHNDPEYFPIPEIFDPDRFHDGGNFEEGTYLPFGNGPRFCLGDRFAMMTIKAGLTKIFEKFSVECGNQEINFEKNGIFLAPSENVYFKFKPIN